MAEETGRRRVHERWAHLRFSVIGQLLAAPPDKGELKAAIEALAARTWRHPTTGEPVRFGFSTIERWYYRALNERSDPVGVLRRKLRTNAGQQHAISAAVRRVVIAQYAAHKSWSIKLHHDNLVALAETRPDLKPVPSYPTLRRFMRANGLDKRRRLSPRRTEGAERAETRIVEREVRRYEAEYVNGLWHWDCHHGSRKVLTPRGEWVTPILFGVLDDRSRLACHLQWYLAETAEVIAHGLAQAFQKRGLPRAALSDNGSAMTAAEISEGLARLGILHHTTLPYSPYQNAKQEAFWGPVEGRLIAMLEHVPDLTLAFLNEATQAWVEHEYNRSIHSEIATTPLARFLEGPAVTRPCPDSAALRLAFTRGAIRTQKKSDGSIVIAGRRFEVPNRYRHLARIEVRYAEWDLSAVHLVDERTGNVLARLYPQDKTQNASGLRRSLEPIGPPPIEPAPRAPASPIPPLLQRLPSGLSDFYREMGDLFGVELSPHNRWAGAKVLRDRWQAHIDASLSRPVLIVDEAQETKPAVLAELRLLSSARLDSHILLTVVLAGDGRLLERLRSDELSPLNSRMRVRLALERATPDELTKLLVHALQQAGAVKLMTPELIATLADHAQGNPRALMNIAGELLAVAAQREARHIDEKLFLEMCATPPLPEPKTARPRR